MPTLRGFPAPPEWTEEALCAQVDPELFYPSHGNSSGTAGEARKVCSLCPVKAECLEYALEYESGLMGIDLSYCVAGIWGGLSPSQRKKILRERRVAA